MAKGILNGQPLNSVVISIISSIRVSANAYYFHDHDYRAMARHQPWWVIPVPSRKAEVQAEVVLFLLYRWGNQGTKKSSKLPTSAQQETSRDARVW